MAAIRLTTCENTFEATLLKNKLEQEGIACFLTNENFTTLFPNFTGILGTGVHVMIEESDFDKAMKMMDSGSSIKEIRCPDCNSDQVIYSLGEKTSNKIIVLILSLIFWIPIGK